MNNLTFKDLNTLIQLQFAVLCSHGQLFVADVPGDTLWDLYLNSFKEGDDPVFRDPESSNHNCNNDKHFIRNYGNIVAIDADDNIVTMFNLDVKGSIYESSMSAMDTALKAANIARPFFITYQELQEAPYEKTKKGQDLYQVGHKQTLKVYSQEEADKFGVVQAGPVYTFNHFHVYLPKEFVVETVKSKAAIVGEQVTSHQLFLKGLAIPSETLEVIRDLMLQGSLLRADLYMDKVVEFLQLKKEYEAEAKHKVNWAWKKFRSIPFARFANELIGTTCIALAEGQDINKVCKDFNQRVDPSNYMKAKAPITQKQIEDAANKLAELGYEESFNRRFAVAEDIDINEILYTALASATPAKTALFSNVKATKPDSLSRHKRAEFDNVETVSIDTFMQDILPHSSSVSVLLQGEFKKNLVALTTSEDKSCKPLFKWSNPFSWTYTGNLAGKSNLTEQVSARGGRVDGVFRFSHSWNELEPNQSLMDLHVFLPANKGPASKICDTYGGNKERVGWNHRVHRITQGSQDVDYTDQAPVGFVPVENITFPSLDRLPNGDYKCFIHNWNFRKSGGRGRAEVAFGGELHQYIYPATSHKEWVAVATVTLKDGMWSIQHHLEPVESTSKELWGLDTDKFHKVSLVCLSPNYWGENNIGNKHFLFMLEGCRTEEPLRSFHIENLNSELLAHRKVLEVVGLNDKLMPTDKQLAGLGFTKDSKECLIVRVEGSFKRTVKIQF